MSQGETKRWKERLEERKNTKVRRKRVKEKLKEVEKKDDILRGEEGWGETKKWGGKQDGNTNKEKMRKVRGKVGI